MMRTKANEGRLWAATYCVATACLCAGCGTAAYEAKLDGAVKQIKLDNQFVGLDVSETLVAGIKNEQGIGAKVSLRKPSFFDGPAFTEGAADPRNPVEPLPAERVKPPVLPNFPGFRFSYEIFNTTLNRPPNATHIYFGVQPSEAGVSERIANELQAAVPDAAPPAWSNVPATTPTGGSVMWRTLSINKPQPFWRAGDTTPVERPGLFQIWMYEQQGFQVLVGLRTTMTDDELNELRRNVVAALGTVRVVTPTKIE